jgi:hypothetical protein
MPTPHPQRRAKARAGSIGTALKMTRPADDKRPGLTQRPVTERNCLDRDANPSADLVCIQDKLDPFDDGALIGPLCAVVSRNWALGGRCGRDPADRQCQNRKRVRPPGSLAKVTIAERGSMRYTFHGGGPCDGGLNGAVMPGPLSSGSAGQPWSAHALAMRASAPGPGTRTASPSMTTSASRTGTAMEYRGSRAASRPFPEPRTGGPPDGSLRSRSVAGSRLCAGRASLRAGQGCAAGRVRVPAGRTTPSRAAAAIPRRRLVAA